MNLFPENIVPKIKPKSQPLLCRICGKPVAVEISKTDDRGQAIHEDCYALKLKLEEASRGSTDRSHRN